MTDNYTFITRVSGIPCQCKVTRHSSTQKEFDFQILDRKGYHAPWLERKIDPGTVDNLYQQYQEERAA